MYVINSLSINCGVICHSVMKWGWVYKGKILRDLLDLRPLTTINGHKVRAKLRTIICRSHKCGT